MIYCAEECTKSTANTRWYQTLSFSAEDRKINLIRRYILRVWLKTKSSWSDLKGHMRISNAAIFQCDLSLVASVAPLFACSHWGSKTALEQLGPRCLSQSWWKCSVTQGINKEQGVFGLWEHTELCDLTQLARMNWFGKSCWASAGTRSRMVVHIFCAFSQIEHWNCDGNN